MNETDIRNSLYNYLAIFRSFGNCGIDDDSYFYSFETTSEPKLKLWIYSNRIELYEYDSSKTISLCDYQALLKEFKL